VAFHEAVRSLTAFGERDIGKAVGRVKAMFGSELSDGEIASIVARLWRLAGDSLFAELTAGMKMYHEVTLVKGKKISVPDMVLAGNQRITIIDFKTSAENELLERYRKQVEGYCILASQIYRTPCRGYLCFVLEDEVRYEEVSR
jgi:hypothetical protein